MDGFTACLAKACPLLTIAQRLTGWGQGYRPTSGATMARTSITNGKPVTSGHCPNLPTIGIIQPS